MKKVFFGMLVVSAIMLTACGGGGSAEPVVLDPVPADYAGLTNPQADGAAAGAEVFNTNCASCHGPEGHGDGPAGAALDPAPKNLPELAAQVGDDYLFWRISTGKEGTSMVAWKGILTDEQIWQTVAYIRTLK